MEVARIRRRWRIFDERCNSTRNRQRQCAARELPLFARQSRQAVRDLSRSVSTGALSEDESMRWETSERVQLLDPIYRDAFSAAGGRAAPRMDFQSGKAIAGLRSASQGNTVCNAGRVTMSCRK